MSTHSHTSLSQIYQTGQGVGFDPDTMQCPLDVAEGTPCIVAKVGNRWTHNGILNQPALVIPVPQEWRTQDIEAEALQSAALLTSNYTDMSPRPVAQPIDMDQRAPLPIHPITHHGKSTRKANGTDRINGELKAAGERMLAQARTEQEQTTRLLCNILPQIARDQQLAHHHQAKADAAIDCLNDNAREQLEQFVRVGSCIYRLTAQDKLICVEVPDLLDDIHDLNN